MLLAAENAIKAASPNRDRSSACLNGAATA
jgi:hypothetical protein